MTGTSPSATATDRPEDAAAPGAPGTGDAPGSDEAAGAGGGDEGTAGTSGDSTAIISSKHELVRPPEEARPRSKYRKGDDWQELVLTGKLMYFFGRDAYHPPKGVVLVGATRVNVCLLYTSPSPRD